MTDRIKVVNMINISQSGESNQDSEPNLAVNPFNSLEMAATAFTPSPSGSPTNSPIYYSNDGGNTWLLIDILPGTPIRDQTLRFSSVNAILYAGVLWGTGGPTGNNAALINFDILRTSPISAATPMTRLATRVNDDQPFIQAATVVGGSAAGKDRIYIGSNDRSRNPLAAAIDISLDAAANPAATNTVFVESRNPGRVLPSIRPAIHPNGIVYAVYFASFNATTSDVVIVRDDNWGSGPNPFNALTDSGDKQRGVRIAANVNIPQPTTVFVGQQRVGGDLAVVVDPNNSATVYVCWGDVQPAGTYELHVRRSTDSGATWSAADVRTIANATSCALAINHSGRLAFLYQALTGSAPNQRWQTTLELTNDNFGDITTHILANTPAASPAKGGDPYLGDYLYMLADGNNFHGVFCANNTPNPSNFPSSVAYQRNANFATNTLLNVDNATAVPISIDPFFFTLTENAENVIIGIVLDTAGRPMVDAGILVNTPSGSNITQVSTDSRGRYATPVLAPGAYVVRAIQSGFVPSQANVTVIDTILVTVQNFVLQRTLPFTLNGQVTDTSAVPIAGATIRLNEIGFSTTNTIVTDPTGHYSFSNTNAGSSGAYHANVGATGFTTVSRNFNIPNGATVTQNFQLAKQATLKGHVTDTNAKAIGGASVTTGASQVFTDASGAYSMMLDAGTYTVTVTSTGFRNGVASLNLGAGQTLVQDFFLNHAVPGSITGTVTDDGGNPLGATVEIPGGPSVKTVNGKYTLPNLFPGTYQVKTTAGVRFLPETDTVTVNEGQATVLDIALVLKKPN